MQPVAKAEQSSLQAPEKHKYLALDLHTTTETVILLCRLVTRAERH